MVIENDKAHEMWCPEGRLHSYSASVNRDTCGGMKHMPTCLGSRCAAWRWWDEGGPREVKVEQVPKMIRQGWSEAADQRLAREDFTIVMVNASPARKGYCGKAGQPTWP